ncbi:spore germination protein [Thermoactinomyces daqus]|uniref:Spore germination protein n=1 Tax=Thermoactinomyces daqus TaxID=1329516 RepID=A0A7W1X9F8_9BACL|nr:spore germination protein [Thermoactinomyces daqus]MBA4542482.1 spore germination protein [Thermoactinomyces daqus]
MKKASYRILRLKERRKQKKLEQHNESQLSKAVQEETHIFDTEAKNVEFIKNILKECSDLVVRTFVIDVPKDLKSSVVYLDEMVQKDINHNFIIRPLMKYSDKRESVNDLYDEVYNHLVQAGEVKEIEDMKSALDAILSGDTVVFLDNFRKALVVGTKGWTTRSVCEPHAESVVRGPREGMSETVVCSLSMIRHRLRDPFLRVKYFTKGKRTKTTVALLYIEGVCDEEVVKEAEKRIQDIQIDGILESGYVEEFIVDQMWTPFPLIQNTERPDSVVAHLLEGQFAILVDGSPYALIAPAVFSQFYYSSEDYYERYLIATFLRFIRLLSLFIALLLPSLYIAFVSFHPEMVPSKLLIAMAAGRATVPSSPILEALSMEISVEILREASIRLPSPIGPTIGIVGGLVIGQAAVQAGLISPAFVIVVGLTTISSYANPSYSAAISVRLLRFPMMMFAAAFGLYGIMIAMMLIILHLVQLRSFGVPYMSPFAPLNLKALKDTLIRVPWPWMKKRPEIYKVNDVVRQGGGEK